MPHTKLTSAQITGFWGAWSGWTLDGMDSFIYALVLSPALSELLPKSGYAKTPANVGLAGSILFALFLVGWGLSFMWGPIADRFGRLRALVFTILCYSIFTFLGAFATSVWTLAAFRLLAGVGIGGEWSMGGTFIAEEMPEARRKMAAGLMLLLASRRKARVNADGELVLLEDQERTLWDQEEIAEGAELLERALAMRSPGPYQTQAAINVLHAQARRPEETDWAQIVALYDVLYEMVPSPVVELNRAVAVAMARDAAKGGLTDRRWVGAEEVNEGRGYRGTVRSTVPHSLQTISA